MKKTKVLLGMFALAALGFTSCSSDDDGNSGTLAGTYDLKEVNVATGVDFDEDGDSNTDLTEESNCYDSGRITLNSDGTLSFKNSYVLVDETLGTAECTSATFPGTYTFTQSGSTITVNATYVDADNDEINVTMVKNGDELTYTTALGQYPVRNSEGGAEYATGPVEYVFRK